MLDPFGWILLHCRCAGAMWKHCAWIHDWKELCAPHILHPEPEQWDGSCAKSCTKSLEKVKMVKGFIESEIFPGCHLQSSIHTIMIIAYYSLFIVS